MLFPLIGLGLAVSVWLVLKLLASIRLWKLSTVSFVAVDRMSGPAFESFVADLLRSRGWKITETGKTGDCGVDLVGMWNGRKYAIQCKRSAGTVSGKAVQEVVAGKAVYGATATLVITNATFTRLAKKLARLNWCLLVDREVLRRWLLKARQAA